MRRVTKNRRMLLLLLVFFNLNSKSTKDLKFISKKTLKITTESTFQLHKFTPCTLSLTKVFSNSMTFSKPTFTIFGKIRFTPKKFSPTVISFRSATNTKISTFYSRILRGSGSTVVFRASIKVLCTRFQSSKVNFLVRGKNL